MRSELGAVGRLILLAVLTAGSAQAQSAPAVDAQTSEAGGVASAVRDEGGTPPSESATPADATPADDTSAPPPLAGEVPPPPVAIADSELWRYPWLTIGAVAGLQWAPKDHALKLHSAEYVDYARVAPYGGGRVGVYPVPVLGIEGELGLIPSTAGRGQRLMRWTWQGALVWQMPRGPWLPFVSLGYGNLNVSSEVLGDDSDLAVVVGAGVKYRITSLWEARVDIRDVFTQRQSASRQPQWPELLLGVSYALGRWHPQPRPLLVVDEDHDGVADHDDRCPGTAANTLDGCPEAR